MRRWKREPLRTLPRSESWEAKRSRLRKACSRVIYSDDTPPATPMSKHFCKRVAPWAVVLMHRVVCSGQVVHLHTAGGVRLYQNRGLSPRILRRKVATLFRGLRREKVAPSGQLSSGIGSLAD